MYAYICVTQKSIEKQIKINLALRRTLTKTQKFICRKESHIKQIPELVTTKVTHGYLIGKTEHSICPSCNTDITIKHIIIDNNTIFTQARVECQIPNNLFEAIRK